ncbi:methyl-accepting chemotaxis protein [Chrysiogenes arsenatis]|uniref:methyl-accepting chemotaxis protein n=1 Tax=Chrysiogenes arsenatis TaxID=309797 RepID=UPI00041CC403|nr:methyl-accepting chemotaxis protein [Chrysiogenes arsenatis]
MRFLRSFLISTRLYLGFGGILAITLLVMALSVTTAFDNMIQTNNTRNAEMTYKIVLAQIAEQGRLSVMLSDAIANIPDFSRMAEENDRQGLQAALGPVFEKFKTTYGLRQFQFHTIDAKAMLRLHMPQKHGDDLSSFRHTVVAANKNRAAAAGLEAGVADLGLRGVVPVFHEGKHVGSLEFGFDFGEKFVQDLKRSFGVDVALYTQREGKFVAHASTFRDQGAFLSDQEMRHVVSGGQATLTGMLKNEPVDISAYPLQDFSGSTVGVLEIVTSRAEVAAQIASLRTALIVIGVLLLLFAVLASYLIATSIITSLRRVHTVTKDLAQGEGDLTVRLPDDAGRDELHRLSHYFNRFIDKTEQMISGTYRMIGNSAGAIAGVLEVMGRVRSDATRSADNASELSASAHEMSATINEISRNIADATDAAERTVTMAGSGAKQLEASTNSIRQLGQEIDALADEIRELQQSAKQIGAVVGVINDISEQTNLLALNAAIEAARAGEAGRGFAVVADEVRKLAENTQRSTKEIESAIRMIVTKVEAASVKAHQASELTAAQADVSREAQQSFHEISSAIDSMGEMFLSVNAAMEEQSVTTEQIADNIDNMAERFKSLSNQVVLLSDNADVIVGNLREMGDAFGSLKTNNRSTPFIKGKIAHVLLLHNILARVNQGNRDTQIPDHNNCGFGKICASHLMDEFRNDPDYMALAQPHKQVHEQALSLLHAIGGTEKELDSKREAFERVVHQFIERLDHLIVKYSSGNNGVKAALPPAARVQGLQLRK